jgi:hypothetical protein
MEAIIEDVELEDQEMARVVVSFMDKQHTLRIYADKLFDDDAVLVIRRELQKKLQAEQEIMWLVGEAFDLRRKAYAE